MRKNMHIIMIEFIRREISFDWSSSFFSRSMTSHSLLARSLCLFAISIPIDDHSDYANRQRTKNVLNWNLFVKIRFHHYYSSSVVIAEGEKKTMRERKKFNDALCLLDPNDVSIVHRARKKMNEQLICIWRWGNTERETNSSSYVGVNRFHFCPFPIGVSMNNY